MKYGAALLGLVLGYGKMQSDVAHLQGDVTEVKMQVGKVYDHLAWGERGGVGPAPPVTTPDTGRNKP